ncbi:uncharacterized protein FIBRA_09302 [Fibroporia radiculosa]|uniref:Uncharacterized protein n=1 Tax=Fibroporia radiculosa TaxID=599839 RepID=J7RHC8_9APHY|nr:uncharacterized protein FIBRA_09302 [Fibroporia radiculosa]CCM06987.1 predicted protein [Fibroporia radiculosa]
MERRYAYSVRSIIPGTQVPLPSAAPASLQDLEVPLLF